MRGPRGGPRGVVGVSFGGDDNLGKGGVAFFIGGGESGGGESGGVDFGGLGKPIGKTSSLLATGASGLL